MGNLVLGEVEVIWNKTKQNKKNNRYLGREEGQKMMGERGLQNAILKTMGGLGEQDSER